MGWAGATAVGGQKWWVCQMWLRQTDDGGAA
jgi:hypothetical protein